MSRSPEEIVGIDSAQEYIEAFKELYRLQAKGRSFSGYERHCAYLNTGGGRFANISATSGLDFSDDGRGVAPRAAGRAGRHGLDRCAMGFGEIDHVNVVTYTGPIGCGVVTAKDAERVAALSPVRAPRW